MKNFLDLLSSLEKKGQRNKYLVARHGQSEANTAGIINSNMAGSTTKYGLTKQGVEQVAKSSRKIEDQFPLDRRLIICSSPFLRCQQTSKLLCHNLKTKDYLSTYDLGERWFGELDMKTDDHYKKVWSKDKKDPSHNSWGVESAEKVAQRVTSWIWRIEQLTFNYTVIVVTHGDPGNILLSAAEGRPLSDHRHNPLALAEIRELILNR